MYTTVLGVLFSIVVSWSSAQVKAFGSSCADVASGYASANPGCSLSSDCTELICSYPDGIDVNATIFNCEDPVRMVVSLKDSDQDCKYTYYYGAGTSNDLGLRGEPLHVIRSRNVSHLYLSVSSGTWPISNTIIPPVDIPLAPAQCMYEDFQDAANSFHLPPGLAESCTSETKICHGFHCNFTGIGETYSTCVTIEPCNETLQVTIKDSVDQVQYDEVFNTNKSVHLYPQTGPDFNLTVHLHHYNYSMDAELSVIVSGFNFPLLPHRRFILDRTKCSPFIPFPAPPAPVADPMVCNPPFVPINTSSCSALATSYAASNPGCKLSSDCLQVDCSLAGFGKSQLVVFNCEDPVRAVFTLTESVGQCSRVYGVSGPGLSRDQLLQEQSVSVTYSRNASHLQFSASSDQSSGPVIPLVKVPLTPDKCMFGDFVNTSRNIVLPAPLTQSCVAETSKCGGVLCNFTAPLETYETCITMDPCTETLQIVIRDSLDSSVFDEVFSQSRSIYLTPRSAQPFTLYVILDHYNYSMEAMMLVKIDFSNLPPGVQIGNITILPRQRFILDRTKCYPFKMFPAAPDKWGTPMKCNAPATSTPNTSSHSHLTLAIVIPVVLVVVAVTAAAVILALLLVHRHFKKRTEIGFRRISFKADDDDDDDDD